MTLPLEYSDIITLVLFLFAAIGLMRGWYKEGITTFFTAALAILVWKPDVARSIIEVLNDLIKRIVEVFRSILSIQPQAITVQKVDAGLLDATSYQLYIGITVVLLVLSYVVGEATFKGKITPLGRLLGGLLGAFNGYIIFALVKQYVLNQLQSQGTFSAQSDGLSVQVTGVPTSNFFAGTGIIFIFIVVIGVVALLVAGDRIRLPLK